MLGGASCGCLVLTRRLPGAAAPLPSGSLQEVEQNVQLRVLHEHSEKFDLRAEGVFKYLQIFTAMANR